MNRTEWLRPVHDTFSGEQFKPTLILLLSPLLMLAWKYGGSPEFFLRHLSPASATADNMQIAAAIYSFTACFVLLGTLPALVVKLVFRERLADYGVCLGDRARTVRSFLILAPVFVLAAYIGSGNPVIRAVYPINKSAGLSAPMFVLHVGTYLVFYLGWEFHFRGFLQFGLRARLGDANALLIQVMASSLLHIGKPYPETIGAFFAGILWGVIALRTRSLLSGLLQHCLLGIALDWFICYR